MTTFRRLPLLAFFGVVGATLSACASSGARPASIDVQPGVSTVAPAPTSASTAVPATAAPSDGSTSATRPSTASTASATTAASRTTAPPAVKPAVATLAVANPDADGKNGDGPTDVRIEVIELTRQSGDSVRLRFVITNNGNDKVSLSDNLGEKQTDYSVGGVSLVDLANDQRYLVVRDQPAKEGELGQCACTRFGTSIDAVEPGAARTLDATFPAPPASVKVVDVQLPVFGAVRDVPIASGNG